MDVHSRQTATRRGTTRGKHRKDEIREPSWGLSWLGQGGWDQINEDMMLCRPRSCRLPSSQLPNPGVVGGGPWSHNAPCARSCCSWASVPPRWHRSWSAGSARGFTTRSVGRPIQQTSHTLFHPPPSPSLPSSGSLPRQSNSKICAKDMSGWHCPPPLFSPAASTSFLPSPSSPTTLNRKAKHTIFSKSQITVGRPSF